MKMQSLDDQLLNSSILNQRVIGTLSRVLTNIDSQLEKELLAYIAKNGVTTLKDINNLKAITSKYYTGKSLEDIRHQYKEIATDFALAESEQLTKSFNKSTVSSVSASILGQDQLIKIVSNAFFVNATIDEFLNNYAYKQKEEIIKLARYAYSQSLTQQQLSNLIAGTKDFKYKDGFFNKRSNITTTIARTTLNGVQNAVRSDFYKSQSKYIKGVKISVTFDGRTSDICASLSALDELYPVGTDVTGQHPNCRSTMIPVIKDEYDIFTSGKTKPAVVDGEVIQIPRKQRYDTLLNNRSAEFQREALGASKYRLFKKGVPLEKFVDASGKPYSVAELRQKYKELLNK